MARRQRAYTEGDFQDLLEGRASKSEQKRHVQRMAALAEQLAELPKKQLLKHAVVNFNVLANCSEMKMKPCY